ncbi:hypothetical protein COV11_04080 [Candidatus Woesearchaeota archaeon CG10_big_fil_rev_8_21_14_0_10_30_7]|nr:MAG: hypothetical protein COV11_04080 [Candidatus Woesearchaeota archaeon CG10_big_fil_rev_8_21_14_0_10_30_7]
MDAHQNHPVKEGKQYRKWDGKTPYYTHPIWCATMIATETTLEEKTREEGVQTLLYHDVLEDTTEQLPNWLSERVKKLIQQMTYEGMAHEMSEIWEKPKEVRLYKLYDKASNLLDGQWMSSAKRNEYHNYTRRLLQDVEQNYGTLNITKLARAILGVKNER